MNVRNEARLRAGRLDMGAASGWKQLVSAVVLSLLILSGAVSTPLAYAGDPASTPALSGQEEVGATVDSPEQASKGGKGKKLFWIVLGVSILFVIGSALSLNAMGGQRQAPGKTKDEQDSGG